MDESPRPRQAACLVCRRSKIKCDWDAHQARCRRCVQLDAQCIRPEYHPGRQKGIKNKRTGLDKALYQVGQAIKRARSNAHGADEDGVVERLRGMLQDHEGEDSSPAQASLVSRSQSHGATEEASSSPEDGAAPDADLAPDEVDGAENPLQLLARASYIQPSPGRSPAQPRVPAPLASDADEAETHEFFAPPSVVLDVGPDIDPLTLGLVTDDEAESLCAFFHQNLAHTRWGLDPRLYTLAFTRSRSAFLLTSMMAASALFLPAAASLSRRLSNHARRLAHEVALVRRCKSVEVVLALMVNVPWMFPGRHSTGDETCAYMALATSIAVDLSLHKALVPVAMRARASLPRADCLDPAAALAMDGFGDVEPWSTRGRLLLRNRERCWISLFVLERGQVWRRAEMSLARGRPFTVPLTRSLRDCDGWHRSDLADPMDGHLLSMAVLRRDLDGLFATVRALCDGSQTVSSDGELIAQSIQGAIERFFGQWYSEWGTSIGIGQDRRLPPYVEILVTHTRLSTYGSVINHPTAPLEVRRFFHTAGLSAALAVMRAAIQGEAQLQSMPNNTAIMISFAACFALTLAAGASALAPSIRGLIAEAAAVLERIGAVTPHRNGLSARYGRHLRLIVKQHAPPPPPPVSQLPAGDGFLEPLWPGTLQFSAMSDDQILQVLNEPGNDVEPALGGLSWDDSSNFEWLSWPEFGL